MSGCHQAGLGRGGRVGQAEQVVEGEQTGVVAVGPDGLNGVAPDGSELTQLKRGGLERLGGAFVELAENVPFPLASRAGAGSPQGIEAEIALAAILPLDGQFLADGLEVFGAHGGRIEKGMGHTRTGPAVSPRESE